MGELLPKFILRCVGLNQTSEVLGVVKTGVISIVSPSFWLFSLELDEPRGPDFTRKCADSGKSLGVESISSEEVEERLLSESLLFFDREATPPPMWSRPVILLVANISMWQAHFETWKEEELLVIRFESTNTLPCCTARVSSCLTA